MLRAGFGILAGIIATPAFARGLGAAAAPGVPWVRLILSLAFCLAVAWGAVLLLRHFQRRGGGNPLTLLRDRSGPAQRRIVVIETRRASMHADLCLVECDGETYFLALSAGRVTVLGRGGGAGGSVA